VHVGDTRVPHTPTDGSTPAAQPEATTVPVEEKEAPVVVSPSYDPSSDGDEDTWVDISYVAVYACSK